MWNDIGAIFFFFCASSESELRMSALQKSKKMLIVHKEYKWIIYNENKKGRYETNFIGKFGGKTL